MKSLAFIGFALSLALSGCFAPTGDTPPPPTPAPFELPFEAGPALGPQDAANADERPAADATAPEASLLPEASVSDVLATDVFVDALATGDSAPDVPSPLDAAPPPDAEANLDADHPDADHEDAGPLASILSLTATPSSFPGLVNGRPVWTATLSWNVVGATSMRIAPGVGAVTGTNHAVSIAQTTTFTLTASAPGGDVTKDVTVSVDDGVLGVYADPIAGLDSNPGTPAFPVQTLSRATQLTDATRSTIYLGAGTYGPAETAFQTPGGAIVIPNNVTVTALEPGQVAFQSVVRGPSSGGSLGLTFAGSGKLAGVQFRGFNRAILATAGMVQVSEVTFADVGDPAGPNSAIHAMQTSQVDLQAPSTTEYTPVPGHAFALVSDQAKLYVHGGSITGAAHTGSSSTGLFTVAGTASLELSGVTLKDNAINAVFAQESSSVSITDSALLRSTLPLRQCCTHGTLVLEGNAKVSLTRSSIANSILHGIFLAAGAPHLSLTDAKVEDNAQDGIGVDGELSPTATIVAARTSIANNGGRGIRMAAGLLHISDASAISRNGSDGVSAGGLLNVRLRNASITDNTGTGISLSPTAGSSVDFGKTDGDEGNNLFLNNQASARTGTNVLVSMFTPTTFYVYAVGNQWNANNQGSTATGVFDRGRAPGVIFSSPPNVVGRNVTLMPLVFGASGAGIKLVADYDPTLPLPQ